MPEYLQGRQRWLQKKLKFSNSSQAVSFNVRPSSDAWNEDGLKRAIHGEPYQSGHFCQDTRSVFHLEGSYQWYVALRTAELTELTAELRCGWWPNCGSLHSLWPCWACAKTTEIYRTINVESLVAFIRVNTETVNEHSQKIKFEFAVKQSTLSVVASRCIQWIELLCWWYCIVKH